MKRIVIAFAMLAAACAPEIPRVAETSGGEAEGAAGSVAVDSEALLVPTCTAATFCAAQKAFVNMTSGTTWTWSTSPCGAIVPPWNGTAPGGRTAHATLPSGDLKHRYFELSQQWSAVVHCTCPAQNTPDCHF